MDKIKSWPPFFFFLLEKLFNLDTGHNREEKAIKTSVSCRLELFFKNKSVCNSINCDCTVSVL